jgi:hypothetical protein
MISRTRLVLYRCGCRNLSAAAMLFPHEFRFRLPIRQRMKINQPAIRTPVVESTSSRLVERFVDAPSEKALQFRVEALAADK